MTRTREVADYGHMTSFRNLFINGAFDVWQRGTSFTTTGTYTADRWRMDHDADTMTVNKVNGSEEVGDIYPQHMMEIAIIASGGSYNYIRQRIENVKNFSSKYVTFSFWIYSTLSGQSVIAQPQQNFGSGGSAQVNITEQSQEIPQSTWHKIEMTFYLPSIEGKSIGSSNYLHIRLELPSNVSGTYYLSTMQLEYGQTATPFEIRPQQTELALCQRYFEKSYEQATAPGTNADEGRVTLIGYASNASSITYANVYPFVVTKRVIPSMTFYTGGGTIAQWNMGFVNANTAPGVLGEAMFSPLTASSSGMTTGNCYPCIGHFTADAEL